MKHLNKTILTGALAGSLLHTFGDEALDTNLNFVRFETVGKNHFVVAYSSDLDVSDIEIISGNDCSYDGIDLFEITMAMPSPETGKGAFVILGTYQGEPTYATREKWVKTATQEVILELMTDNREFFDPIVGFARFNRELGKLINEVEQIS